MSSVRVNPTPTNLASISFTVTFSEAVTGVDKTDFSHTTSGITGATVTGVTGSGATRTVTVNSGTGSGTLRLNVAGNDSIADSAGNKLGGTGAGNGSYNSGQSYTVDKTTPKVSSSVRANNSPTNLTSVSFTVTFSETVTGVDAADFSLTPSGVTGAAITSVMGTGTRTALALA